MIVEATLLLMCVVVEGLLLFTYIIYPIGISFVSRIIEREDHEYKGKDIIIIPAYNEQDVIENKILNILKHCDKNSIIVIVSDSSNDNTNMICERLAKSYKNIRFIANKKRSGKNTCLNLAVETINPHEDDIIIFTDCNTFFDEESIPEIKKSLLSGAALAAGSMVYESKSSDSAKSEGLYWKYEEWIRRNESKIGRLIVCNGGLFGMWAKNYKMLPPYVPNDFEGPLRLCGEGKNVVINPAAKGYEIAINSTKEEYERKQRQANRQMNCIIYLWNKLDITTRLQVLFHKFFRWYGLYLFIGATFLFAALAKVKNNVVIDLLFYSHLIVILLMILAFINQYLKFDKKILPKIIHAIYVHVFSAKGANEAIKGGKKAIWEKAKTNR